MGDLRRAVHLRQQGTCISMLRSRAAMQTPAMKKIADLNLFQKPSAH